MELFKNILAVIVFTFQIAFLIATIVVPALLGAPFVSFLFFLLLVFTFLTHDPNAPKSSAKSTAAKMAAGATIGYIAGKKTEF